MNEARFPFSCAPHERDGVNRKLLVTPEKVGRLDTAMVEGSCNGNWFINANGHIRVSLGLTMDSISNKTPEMSRGNFGNYSRLSVYPFSNSLRPVDCFLGTFDDA